MFATFAVGLQQLSNAIVSHLDPSRVKLNCRVDSLTKEAGRYKIALGDGSFLDADTIVFTAPAYATASIVENIDPVLAAGLRRIRYVTTATVSLGFKRADIQCSLTGLGFIVPAGEGRRINACSWSSTKFTQRAPDDCVLMRTFIGGALAEQLAEQDDDALIQLAREELREIMGITATPVLAKAYRWRKANPQYEIGHRALVSSIEERTASHPGFYLAGAAYHGAGIPDCVQSGMKAALNIVKAQTRTPCSCHSASAPVPASA